MGTKQGSDAEGAIGFVQRSGTGRRCVVASLGGPETALLWRSSDFRDCDCRGAFDKRVQLHNAAILDIGRRMAVRRAITRRGFLSRRLAGMIAVTAAFLLARGGESDELRTKAGRRTGRQQDSGRRKQRDYQTHSHPPSDLKPWQHNED